MLNVTGALGLARFGYTMIVPGMRDGLDLSDTQMGLLASGFFVGYLCASFAVGVAFDFRRNLLAGTALAVTGVSMALTGLVTEFEEALILRIVSGTGSGIAFVVTVALASGWYEVRRRGLVSGALLGGAGLGIVAAGVLVPALTLWFGSEGWRYSWVVMGIATAAFGVLAMAILPSKATSAVRFRSREGRAGIGNWFRHSIWRIRPIIRSVEVWAVAGMYGAYGFSYIIFATFFAAFLISEADYSLSEAGAAWFWIGGLSSTSGLVWGITSDRVGRKRGLIYCLVTLGLASAVLAGVRAPWGVWSSVLLFGLSAWGVAAIVPATMTDLLGRDLNTAAIGFVTTFLGIGFIVAPAAAGILRDMTGTFQWPLYLGASLAWLGALVVGAVDLSPRSIDEGVREDAPPAPV